MGRRSSLVLLRLIGAEPSGSVASEQISQAYGVGAITTAEGKMLLRLSRLDPRGKKYQTLISDGESGAFDSANTLSDVKALTAWRDEKAALIETRTDLTLEQRNELHRVLRAEWAKRALEAMPKQKRRGRRTQAQMRADLGMD